MKRQDFNERELLKNILDPNGYRQALAEKLKRQGMEIVKRERWQDNPYKRTPPNAA